MFVAGGCTPEETVLQRMDAAEQSVALPPLFTHKLYELLYQSQPGFCFVERLDCTAAAAISLSVQKCKKVIFTQVDPQRFVWPVAPIGLCDLSQVS